MSDTGNNSNVEVENRKAQPVPEFRLPRKFLDCSRTHLVVLISRMLSSLIRLNDAYTESNTLQLTRFHSRVPPSISVYDYLIRLTKYSSLEHCVLLASVYYIDLLSSVFPEFRLDSLTVHRFLLTATTVASKGLCDSFCTNTHYAKVGGVQCNELNVLENEFLTRVNYRILPRDENIKRCSREHQEGTFSFANIPADAEQDQKSEENRFDVLENYYHRMIHLIGNLDASPDKSYDLNFTLEEPELVIDPITFTLNKANDNNNSSYYSNNYSNNTDNGGNIRNINNDNDDKRLTLDTKDRNPAISEADISPQTSKKRNYSDSNPNCIGLCNQIPITKKRSNGQTKHPSPSEIV
ncbi:Pho80p Ecym_3029 [Eremothecium cymbalariae DBVPG|uniref:Cyclin-like domain-containing protein n=1 Tax=Eremothecium cymbalariae (strain CBS 270.75 / DBVPG 7215 / KCTC 17166 / NRRL Y-17582) TaxID=931890 RepID=G8JQX5_ERECY|nr:Hypothetical protein Ecym_3029 [Eremothecium cymbalariae DBVPG\